jgi:hypothetical protein
MDTTPKLFRQNWEMSTFGGFLFGQAVAASMERHGRGGTILFTVSDPLPPALRWPAPSMHTHAGYTLTRIYA